MGSAAESAVAGRFDSLRSGSKTNKNEARRSKNLLIKVKIQREDCWLIKRIVRVKGMQNRWGLRVIEKAWSNYKTKTFAEFETLCHVPKGKKLIRPSFCRKGVVKQPPLKRFAS